MNQKKLSRRNCYALNIVRKTARMFLYKFPHQKKFNLEEDLIIIGKEVLIKARNNYDPNKKIKFKTYLIRSLQNKYGSELKKSFIKHKHIKNYYLDPTVEISKSEPHLDLNILDSIKDLRKNLSIESLEIVNKILNAPRELIKLNRIPNYIMWGYLKISKPKFYRFKDEVKQLIR
jgi:DNA-directed RNA polymerase specialized sigma subunit